MCVCVCVCCARARVRVCACARAGTHCKQVQERAAPTHERKHAIEATDSNRQRPPATACPLSALAHARAAPMTLTRCKSWSALISKHGDATLPRSSVPIQAESSCQLPAAPTGCAAPAPAAPCPPSYMMTRGSDHARSSTQYVRLSKLVSLGTLSVSNPLVPRLPSGLCPCLCCRHASRAASKTLPEGPPFHSRRGLVGRGKSSSCARANTTESAALSLVAKP